MKVGLGTKIFLGMAVAFTGLLGIMYLIYVSLSSVSSSDSNHRQEQFSSSASYINNSVTYTNNFCTECGAQCPRDTELH
jgi:membrane protease subunit (stomatin/prohibitin family)